MDSGYHLLTNLLRTLIEEWGSSQVEAALKELIDPENVDARDLQRSATSKTVRPRKRLAREQIEQSKLSDLQKEVLRDVADRFDRKQFLPSNSDVREFLLMTGVRPGVMKDRSEAFKRLLEILSHLSAEKLREFADKAKQYGPSQLGPLSDAISDVAAATFRQRERKRFNY